MATALLTNKYWAYGQAPDIRFDFKYDSRRVGADMQYKFYWVFHSLNTPQSGFGWPIYGTVSLDGRTKLNGIQIKGVQPMQWFDSETVKFSSDWVTVSGKLTGTVSWSMTLFSGSGMTRSETWSGTLAVLPAQSSFTVSSAVIGSDVTVSISKAQSDYTHTVDIRISSTYHLTATAVDSAHAFSIPMSWANGIKTATVGEMTVTVTTFDGSTQIGSPVVQAVPISVPASVVPSLSVSVSAVSGFGSYYLTGISQAKFTNTATMAYGATVSSIVITLGSQSGSGASWTSGTFGTAGTVAWTVIVTDSRGRTATKTGSITITAYTTPTISGQQPYRCLSNKTASESGTYALCKATVAYTALTGNTVTIRTAYKLTSAASYTSADTVSGSSINIAGCGGHLLVTAAYDVKITATDTVGNSAEFVGTILSSANYYFTAAEKKFRIGGYVDKTLSDGLQIPDDLHIGGSLNAETINGVPEGKMYLRQKYISSIPANADLDSYTLIGLYGITATATARSLINAPAEVTENGLFGRMYVVNAQGRDLDTSGTSTSVYLHQIYLPFQTKYGFWMRRGNSSTGTLVWQTWDHIAPYTEPTPPTLPEVLFNGSSGSSETKTFDVSGHKFLRAAINLSSLDDVSSSVQTNYWQSWDIDLAELTASKRYYGCMLNGAGPYRFSLAKSGDTLTYVREGSSSILLKLFAF